ncbi:MAG: hypothetical protein H6710_24880, partial [Myxococcales bacterium]|nr:hypothetical protein [Myxococcales bacterium]
PGWPCEITCDGIDACASAQLNCPEEGCTIKCGKSGSCQMATVNCGSEGTCDLQCNSGNQVCQGVNFKCGRNSGAVTCASSLNSLNLVPDGDSLCECTQSGCL